MSEDQKKQLEQQLWNIADTAKSVPLAESKEMLIMILWLWVKENRHKGYLAGKMA